MGVLIGLSVVALLLIVLTVIRICISNVIRICFNNNFFFIIIINFRSNNSIHRFSINIGIIICSYNLDYFLINGY